ncbi:unnamed protein product, partial [Rotaria magnacalcarata]
QRLRDPNSNSTMVQASYDGLVKPLKSTFEGNVTVRFFIGVVVETFLV